jgi:GTP-dependent phosphoenolpyruvate carboxykinase
MDSAGSDTVEVASGIGHAGPTLNDIISHHNLKEEHLQRVCSQNVRLKIAKKLNDWKMLGVYLKLTEPDLTAIDRDNTTEDQRRVATLNTWHKREGRNATYLRLAGALYERGRREKLGPSLHF